MQNTNQKMLKKLIPYETFLKRIEKRKNLLPRQEIITNAAAPTSYSLQSYAPVPYNQGQLGSCTANAIAGLIKMTENPAVIFEPSRLFIYTMELMQENPGKPITDLGADAADGCTIISNTGVCPEIDMPYTMDANQNVIGFGKVPSATALQHASLHKYPMFKDVTNNGALLNTIKTCISAGQPVLLAFIVFNSFMSNIVKNNGIMPMPSQTELKGQPVGGHEVLVVGYDAQYLTILNSWGSDWGQKGFFKMPLAYLTTNWYNYSLVNQILVMRSVYSNPNPNPTPVPPSPTPVPPNPNPNPSPTPVPPNPNQAALINISNQLATLITNLATVQNQIVQLAQ